MENIMQLLFNTNHELPSLPLVLVFAVLAIVVPKAAQVMMERKQAKGQVPKESSPARSTPRKKKRKKR